VVTRRQSSARGRGSGGGKPARRTLGRWGQMRGARAWMDETNSARGEKIFRPTGGGSVLTESGGEGPGGVDAAWRRSGRERGGGLARRGAARLRGVDAAAARPRRTWAARCSAIVESGRVGVTRVDVADRWAGMLRGPGRQQLGAAQGSAVWRSARR
jgi:hypothetical protein